MAQLTFREAIARGIAQEMRRDERVLMLGEDIGAAGGVFKGTVGLIDEFGPLRVRDTPISEQAILGAAMGAGAAGVGAAMLAYSAAVALAAASRSTPAGTLCWGLCAGSAWATAPSASSTHHMRGSRRFIFGLPSRPGLR